MGSEMCIRDSVKGVAVAPVALKSTRRSKDQFESSSLVMLDFDSGQSWDELKATEFIQKHGLFAYSTSSYVAGEECQRFRLAIGLDRTITNRDHYEAVIRYLVRPAGSCPRGLIQPSKRLPKVDTREWGGQGGRASSK